ncbi:hypothetical protein TRFO_40430 [Tritrichomonas foetus]|uniref:Uncharacterized protein n=1 Tax=Tritrichomonas foetus TaxID=1144522 RepID=A0A1J4J144_9EUKA|nr:hypothetical protein TRFO_40430 [Tritrichomonas foetus]|eukprot:OHS93256.1 hypothetical protein TRFO_40430 [Tritrichomonas foetus]
MNWLFLLLSFSVEEADLYVGHYAMFHNISLIADSNFTIASIYPRFLIVFCHAPNIKVSYSSSAHYNDESNYGNIVSTNNTSYLYLRDYGHVLLETTDDCEISFVVTCVPESCGDRLWISNIACPIEFRGEWKGTYRIDDHELCILYGINHIINYTVNTILFHNDRLHVQAISDLSFKGTNKNRNFLSKYSFFQLKIDSSPEKPRPKWPKRYLRVVAEGERELAASRPFSGFIQTEYPEQKPSDMQQLKFKLAVIVVGATFIGCCYIAFFWKGYKMSHYNMYAENLAVV